MRTTLYFLMIGFSLLVAIAATYVARRLVARLGTWNAILVGVGAFIVVTAVVGSLLPTVNEVSAEFPATVLWQFRIASLGTQVALWGAFGLVFGGLAQRVLQPRASLLASAAAPGRVSRSGTTTLS